MIKNIRYNGYTTQPSDYDAPDGDLAVALNLINENNSLHPACSPHKVLRLPINGTTKPQIMARSRHIILMHRSKWNTQQQERARILYSNVPTARTGIQHLS